MNTVTTNETFSPRTSDQVLDLPQLLERCMGDLAFAERCLVKFQQRLTADVEQLQQSVNAGDMSEAARIAHLIKGSAATIAATSIAETADALEAAARSGSSGDDDLLFATTQFMHEVKRFIDVVPIFSRIG